MTRTGILRHGYALWGFAALALLSAGCTPSGDIVSQVLNQRLGGVLGDIDLNRIVTIRVINQTEDDTVEVDLLIDGVQRTISCAAQGDVSGSSISTGICDLPLLDCPARIEVLRDRRLNNLGAFSGGREYNGNPAFVFTEDEFDCNSYIIFQISQDASTPLVL